MSDDDLAEPAAADTEGDDDTHEVPADLVELHEVLEYQRLVQLGPSEHA
jgi:hypothetical protein